MRRAFSPEIILMTEERAQLVKLARSRLASVQAPSQEAPIG